MIWFDVRTRALDVAAGTKGTFLVDIFNGHQLQEFVATIRAGARDEQAEDWLQVHPELLDLPSGTPLQVPVTVSPPPGAPSGAHMLWVELELPELRAAIGPRHVALTVYGRSDWSITAPGSYPVSWDKPITISFTVTGPGGAMVRAEADWSGDLSESGSQEYEMAIHVDSPVRILPVSGASAFSAQITAGSRPRPFVLRVYDEATSALCATSDELFPVYQDLEQSPPPQ
ncbi:hypothetical protein [Streptomyces flaveus]|uniref:hypothetical protein n=1 Tax=Streptomyces flaveus TaxID=66370 RepID=UPI0033268B9D